MRSHSRGIMMLASIALGWMAGLAAGQAASAPADPLDEITRLLSKGDAKEGARVLAALRSTDDKDLAVFYTALATSGNKDWRVPSISALADVAGKDAAGVFSDRLKNDPSMVVRTEALLALIALKAVTPDELVLALGAPDENIQCIAARTLLHQGQKKDEAAAALKKLAASRDVATSAMARMALLGLGRKEQFAPLHALMKDPANSGDVLAILLEQVAEEKIAPAMELLDEVVKSDLPWQVKLRAHRAISALSEKVPASLMRAIPAGDQTAFRVHLMRVLAWRADSGPQIDELAKGEDAIAVLARFEQARPKGGGAASLAAVEAAKLGHPVVIEYLLDRARQDVKDKGAAADFYVGGLAQVIESVHTDPQEIRQEHYLAAKAATILADCQSAKAVAELKRLLAGKYTAITRAVATGLLRTKNPAACDLLRPLLDSPYSELATDAALLLGRFGDKEALPALKAIAAAPDRHPTLLLVLANWYILKIDGRSKAAAEGLARTVR